MVAVPFVRIGGGWGELNGKKKKKKAYDTVRSEQHGVFKLPFSWDEGDGTGEPAFFFFFPFSSPHPPPMRTRGTATTPRMLQIQ